MCKQYEHQSSALLLLLVIRLSNPNHQSLDAVLILKQLLSTLWYSAQFYLLGAQGGSIGGCGSESAPLPSASSHTDPHVIQIVLDVLTATLANSLLEYDMELEPRGYLMTVDERNTCPWWGCHPGSAWVPNGDYDLPCLLCSVLLS